ncbi:hypothetical protein SEA_TWISTER6_6 [Gordonia phage Twister6]|uniref:Uncharacterized protein n=6 Tax=Wizardvirus TaxID=2169658 RepID=A0A4Y5TZ09_9CAUD|nr:hypothetical protein BI083_gp06 [Gordonia phage Twister6]YP_010096611.1 hypothetical protein KNT95_gp06 [Gordonia phage Danyall]YP_010100808.1 hypothetical protein KNU39_gp06 [Gordonia phage Mutzi]YP_010102063.1 hypothetical protein KNU54_gp06 [Gordonia phage VanDeWege]YP_010103610.1 hypothetical protein KNU68_gp06 [Gordonia phage Nubi]WNO27876.1 membrane protein [Gordonia phage Halo3]AOE44915.1 hypothetical protein SEA_TWISTER6_6 [Gordonia phage Twister6]AXH45486.1 hypothetical protein S
MIMNVTWKDHLHAAAWAVAWVLLLAYGVVNTTGA